MAGLSELEKTLDGVFVKNAPKLPENGKKMLVSWLPWINLVAGILSLWAAYTLYHWAHIANGLINYANQVSQAFGGPAVSSRLTATVWLGIVVIVVEGIIYLMAYPETKARTKRGWDLMFIALLVNIVYGAVLLLTDYGGVGNFIGSLIGSVIGLWLLFQIRGKYLGHTSRTE